MKRSYCDDCGEKFPVKDMLNFEVKVDPEHSAIYCEDCADNQIDYYGRSGYEIIEVIGKVIKRRIIVKHKV